MFEDELLQNRGVLKAYALKLTKDTDRAIDLVQDVLLRAWEKQHQYQRGTSLKAWLLTITLNVFRTQFRKTNRLVYTDLPPDVIMPASQPSHLDFQDTETALRTLPEEMREAIIMVGVLGTSYEEAADVANVPLGTMKSRVSRARSELRRMLP